MSKLNRRDLSVLIEYGEKETLTIPIIREILGVSDNIARAYKALYDSRSEFEMADDDVILENVRLAKQKQSFQDTNRIERKSFREYARVENALEALNKAVLEKLDQVNLSICDVVSVPAVLTNNAAIIQISDTHFNELVDLKNNRYDFIVASKRLQKFAAEAKMFLSACQVKTVVIAMTGDMINSDRRLDEKLNMATNRVSACMIAVQLLEFFINDIANHFENVKVMYVTGNESRINEEFGFTDLVITDNYDSIIFNVLKRLYRDHTRVEFIADNPVEAIVSLNKRNILMMHGTTLGVDSQKAVQQVIGKYVAKGIDVHYAIFGHIHFANVTDLYARSGSLVGNNTYSDFSLNLVTKASQNIHIVKENGDITNIRVELDGVDDFPGYPIQGELAEYNAKSASKLHQHHKVIEIII